MRTAFIILSLLITSLISASSVRSSSNYDPHAPSGDEGLWFEGWYTRITDPHQKKAFAAILGSFCAKDTSCNHMQGLPGYLALLYQDANVQDGKLQVIEKFLNQTYIRVGPDRTPVTSNPDFSSPPNFEWYTPEFGSITNGTISLNFPKEQVTFKADMTNPLYWNPSIPGEGPEGDAMYLPLQQHWFVYSLGSQTNYQFTGPSGQVSTGSGFAHQEKNWGHSFPSEWIWSEGISPQNDHHFAVTGGNVPVIGPIAVNAWLVGYRSPTLSWSFRPQDIPTFFDHKVIDGCKGVFIFSVSHLTRRVEFEMRADPSTFTWLAIPTVDGFVSNGCVESYATNVTVRAYSFGSLLEEYTFNGAALEFGGGYLCPKKN